jgi:hypothetical protein
MLFYIHLALIKKIERYFSIYTIDTYKKMTMIDYVYQVRIYEGYNEEFCGLEGKWEFDTLEEAKVCYVKYHPIHDCDNIRITRTPKLDEEECDELGIEYEIKIII